MLRSEAEREYIAVHVTIRTESRDLLELAETSKSHEHVARTTNAWNRKISRMTAENQQFRNAGSPGWLEKTTGFSMSAYG